MGFISIGWRLLLSKHLLKRRCYFRFHFLRFAVIQAKKNVLTLSKLAYLPLPLLAILMGCGQQASTASNPSNKTALHDSSAAHKAKPIPAKLLKTFTKDIIPIFEQRCSQACHGVDETGFDAFLEKDPINKIALYYPINALNGKINPAFYRSIYQTTLGHKRINYAELAKFSHLLRAPLAEEYGGQPHRGLDVFYSTDDPDYQILHAWVEQEIKAKQKEEPALPENIAYFQDSVLPLMERNSCFLSSCHGDQVFNDLKLVAPLPLDNPSQIQTIRQRYSLDMILKNRKVMLGTVSELANLGGDLKQSRLIVKNLPIDQGGIHQRGGNNQFFESMQDDDVKRLLHWLKLERKALAKNLHSEDQKIVENELGKIQGMVFIRGPKHTPRSWFSFDQFHPGSDIFLLPLNEGETLSSTQNKAINISAAFHQQPVEIQSLDIRYDAKRVVFSMRKSKDQGFRLYEFSLNDDFDKVEGQIKQISFADNKLKDGTLIHHIDPIYMPGPTDKKGHDLADVAITFASNHAGHYAQSDAWGIIGEADSMNKNKLHDKQRPEAAGTFDGRRISFVAGPNKGLWRTIKQHKNALKKGHGAILVLDKPLPYPVDRATIYVIEKPKSHVLSSYDIWRFIPYSAKSKDTGNKTVLSKLAQYEQSLIQVTYSHTQDRRPTLRTTGETMFTSVRNIGYQGDKPVYNGAIYRVQAGGFDYHIQGGNRSAYGLFSDSRELGNGLELRLLHDPRNLWGGGMLTLSDHGFGINVELDNPVDDNVHSIDSPLAASEFSSPPRFISAQMNFFDEYGKEGVTHTGLSLGGSTKDPYPLLNGSLLLSYTPEPLDHLNPSADPNWDIYRFEFVNSAHNEQGDKVGEFKRIKIAAASSEKAEYGARPIMVRLKEKAARPIHHQKFSARSETIKPQEQDGVLRMPEGLPAEIECYDYPLLQSFLTNFAPVGAKDFRQAKGSPDGKKTSEDKTFKYVRVVMQQGASKAELEAQKALANNDPFATQISAGVHGKYVIVAEAPIEQDGSFYVEVPSNVPLIVQGLNKDKLAMHNMNRWVYLQAGEKLTFGIPRPIYPLRCAGCHGSLTGNPYDGVGPADLVSASSRVMATWNHGEQKRRPAYGFDRKVKDYIAIDFIKDVQPILDEYCVACHSPSSTTTAAADLDLRNLKTPAYNQAYIALHQLNDPNSGNYADKKYINEREALSSESLLISSLLGERGSQHLSGPKGKALPESLRLTLSRWIDLGATFKGADLSKIKDPVIDTTQFEQANSSVGATHDY